MTSQDNSIDFVEWPLNEEGYPYRKAARIVVFNPAGEIFLILGHDIDEPSQTWWFTPGGGIEAEESPADAAVRELREETGLVVDKKRLIGPVLMRYSTFHFAAKTRKQDEEFFVIHIDESEAELINSGRNREWTTLEHHVLDDQTWWNLDSLRAIQDTDQWVFPRDLPEFAREWHGTWDGVCRTIVEE